jgi:hypothetical protein
VREYRGCDARRCPAHRDVSQNTSPHGGKILENPSLFQLVVQGRRAFRIHLMHSGALRELTGRSARRGIAVAETVTRMGAVFAATSSGKRLHPSLESLLGGSATKGRLMKTRLALLFASVLILSTPFLLALPAERDRAAHPPAAHNTPRANQGHVPQAPPARSNRRSVCPPAM